MSILLGIGAVIAGLAGAAGHRSAKEKNEEAERIAQQAKNLYDKSVESLDSIKKHTEKGLVELGYAKKYTLETSMHQFLNAYEKIKEIQFKESAGLEEIDNLKITPQDALQLQEMTNVYSSSLSTGAAGAATGAIVALAVSGNLGIVTSTLGIAGSALAAGEIGAAASIAGSALSFGAAMTPLAAIAAPVVLFTGISASLKADENLEKANTLYSQAKAASEQMKVSETLCNGIRERAEMFNQLLSDLNAMFSVCAAQMDAIISKKTKKSKDQFLSADSFSQEEIKLIAVTRSLAGAIKAVIDTPILTEKGSLSTKSKKVFDDAKKQLPAFTEAFSEVKNENYGVRPKYPKEAKKGIQGWKKTKQRSSSIALSDGLRNTGAIFVGIITAIIFGILGKTFIGIIIGTVLAFLILDKDIDNGFFKGTRFFLYFALVIELAILFWQNSYSISHANHYFPLCMLTIVGAVGVFFLVFFLYEYLVFSSVMPALMMLSSLFALGALAILLFAFLYRLLRFGLTFSKILVEIPLLLVGGLICALYEEMRDEI